MGRLLGIVDNFREANVRFVCINFLFSNFPSYGQFATLFRDPFIWVSLGKLLKYVRADDFLDCVVSSILQFVI